MTDLEPLLDDSDAIEISDNRSSINWREPFARFAAHQLSVRSLVDDSGDQDADQGTVSDQPE